MRQSTDSDYNSANRKIACKIDIYFDGASKSPLTITQDNYLIDCEILEEFGTKDSSPFQELASNSVSISLINTGLIFSPSNVSSPYYNKIKPGVMIKVYLKPNNEDIYYDSMGIYYVMNWIVSSESTKVDIIAFDKANEITSDNSIPFLPVSDSGDSVGYLAMLFDNIPFNVQSNLINIPFLFPKNSRKATINDLVNANRAVATCSRDGTIIVGRLPLSQETRTITDNDQIINMSIPQTFIRKYDDASLDYVMPEIKYRQQVLRLTDLKVPVGHTDLSQVSFTNSPVIAIEHMRIVAPSSEGQPANIKMHLDEAAALTSYISLQNDGDPLDIELTVTGTTLSLNKFSLEGKGRCVKETNEFVQTTINADIVQRYLSTYVQCPIQTLTLRIRGNPRITLGSKIVINSTKYKINFTGIVAELKHTYMGGLSATMTVLNIDAIGGA